MRFITLVRADKNAEGCGPPDPRLMEAMGKLAAEMTAKGILLASDGLFPSSEGARVRLEGDSLTVTDGPFTESKELIASYAILRADSRAHAIELTERFLRLHREVLGPTYVGEVEVRQLFDFGPDGTPVGAQP